MRLGAHVSAAGGFDGLLQRSHGLDVEVAQFFLSSPRTWRFRPLAPAKEGAVMEVAPKLGVSHLVVHAPYLINLGSDDPELIVKSAELLTAIMAAATELALSGVVLHPGSHKGRGFDASLVSWSQAIEATVAIATPTTKLLLENTAGGGGAMGRSVEELIALVDRLNRPSAVGICIDTQHLFAAGYDLRERGVRDELSAELAEAFGSVAVVHLNDSATDLGSAHDRHANLDEGEIGLDALIEFLDHDVFRSADVILEVPGDGDGPRGSDIALLRQRCDAHGLE
jgi:deoxyribonuclease-4